MDLQKFYDEPFVDPNESELNGGLENHLIQSQPLRSRENIYDYKNSPAKYNPKTAMSDVASIRSPSSLGMTQTTRLGSQSSLKSAISLKESPTKEHKRFKHVPVEREIDIKSDKSEKSEFTEKGSIISSSNTTNSSKHDFLSSSPVPRSRTPRSTKSSRTILDAGGIPQTEV
jgi:hypothetical protein